MFLNYLTSQAISLVLDAEEQTIDRARQAALSYFGARGKRSKRLEFAAPLL